MSDKNPNPVIRWETICGIDCLYFKFIGNLSHGDASAAVNEWQNSMEYKNQKIHIVWDCLEMTGYEPMARNVWQKAIREMKGKISDIWLITHSSLIKAGAALMTIFTSYEIRVVRSREEIEFSREFVE
jgi:hypothetical protein